MNWRDYRRYSHLCECMQRTIAGTRLLEELFPLREEQLIFSGIVGVYGKPFKESNGMGRVNILDFEPPPDFMEWHHHLITARDKMYIHSDFTYPFTAREGQTAKHTVELLIKDGGSVKHKLNDFIFFPPAAEPIRKLAGYIYGLAVAELDAFALSHGILPGRYSVRDDGSGVEKIG